MPQLTQNAVEPQVIESIVRGYQAVYQALETERPDWVPELSLQLALSLAGLPNKSWAKQQVDFSIRAWLQQRQLQAGEWMQTIEAMLSVLVEEDREYVEQLIECLTRIEDNQTVDKIQVLAEEKLKQVQASRGEFVLDKTLTGHSAWVFSVAFSPNGEWLASGSHDKTIKIWQLATGKELRTLTGHSTWVYSVAFSPNGELLASGSHDKTIKIWRAV